MKTTTLVLGSLLLTGAAGTASGAASAAGAAAPVVFQWSAAELGSLDGITATHERIRSTANAYCRDYLHGTRSVRQLSHCMRAVTDEIVISIDDPRLTAYARTGTVAKELLARR